ncbi:MULTISPECIES: PqqD family protein [Bacillus cereus group]|uniref:PqqD family protein n=1 Tax=Bacillus proteolyticus TaxID=2026192 RepID=A0ABV3IFE8_9BACI|nr:PqqD family protein [Bacillus cereus group sp. N8]MBJ8107561.1 PqqD family protein [Bacillus cereus group sp. N8]
MIIEEMVYKQDLNYRVRTIAKQHLLFGNGNAYQLNETGLLIWENIDGDHHLNSILNTIINHYKCSEEIAAKDLKSFIEFLLEIKAIKEA